MRKTDEKKFYGMMNDYMFHLVLQESDLVLKNLVSALMDIPLEDMKECHVGNPIDYGKAMDGKEIILDVRLTLNNDTSIDIEVQVQRETFWIERSLLYWSRTYDRLHVKEEYNKLIPTVHIGILNFTLFKDAPEFFSEYSILNNKTGKPYSDKLRIKVLDLSRPDLAGDSPKEQKLLKWVRIFKAKTQPELENLSEGEEVFEEVAEVIEKLNADEEVRLRCEAREDYYRRLRSEYVGGFEAGEKQGIRKGEQRGIRKGIQQERMRTASIIAELEAEIARMKAERDSD